jgi:hypothetical protein
MSVEAGNRNVDHPVPAATLVDDQRAIRVLGNGVGGRPVRGAVPSPQFIQDRAPLRLVGHDPEDPLPESPQATMTACTQQWS